MNLLNAKKYTVASLCILGVSMELWHFHVGVLHRLESSFPGGRHVFRIPCDDICNVEVGQLLLSRANIDIQVTGLNNTVKKREKRWYLG